jgi:hypothetical protein
MRTIKKCGEKSWTVEQLAAHLSVTPGFIYDLIGRQKRSLTPSFRLSDIEKCYAANTVQPRRAKRT